MENLANFDLDQCPFKTFQAWFSLAQEKSEQADAFVLATSSKQGDVSARTLLFKGLHEGKKFSWFTHYDSHKGKDLDENPVGAMVFYWKELGRQIRLRGRVEKSNREVSVQYFSSRPRESQIASYLSAQGQVVESREVLLKRFEEVENKFKDKDVPCPKSWGGYLLAPCEIEFFIYGDHRLNDRFLYTLNADGKWDIKRLQP